MEQEKVIFRREYHPYDKLWGYLAIFPEEEANPGNACCVPFYFDGYGKVWFEPFCEANISYMYKCKIVHKNDKDVPRLLSALEERYEQKFKVVEKIMNGGR